MVHLGSRILGAILVLGCVVPRVFGLLDGFAVSIWKRDIESLGSFEFLGNYTSSAPRIIAMRDATTQFEELWVSEWVSETHNQFRLNFTADYDFGGFEDYSIRFSGFIIPECDNGSAFAYSNRVKAYFDGNPVAITANSSGCFAEIPSKKTGKFSMTVPFNWTELDQFYDGQGSYYSTFGFFNMELWKNFSTLQFDCTSIFTTNQFSFPERTPVNTLSSFWSDSLISYLPGYQDCPLSEVSKPTFNVCGRFFFRCSGQNVTAIILDHPKNWKTLEYIKVDTREILMIPETKLDSIALVNFTTDCTGVNSDEVVISKLDIYFIIDSFTRKDFEKLESCLSPHLQELSLSYLSFDRFPSLTAYQKLEYLDIEGIRNPGSCTSVFPQHSNFVDFDLAYCDLTFSCFQEILLTPGLRDIYFKEGSIQEFGDSGTLQYSENLRKLTLDNVKISYQFKYILDSLGQHFLRFQKSFDFKFSKTYGYGFIDFEEWNDVWNSTVGDAICNWTSESSLSFEYNSFIIQSTGDGRWYCNPSGDFQIGSIFSNYIEKGNFHPMVSELKVRLYEQNPSVNIPYISEDDPVLRSPTVYIISPGSYRDDVEISGDKSFTNTSESDMYIFKFQMSTYSTFTSLLNDLGFSSPVNITLGLEFNEYWNSRLHVIHLDIDTECPEGLEINYQQGICGCAKGTFSPTQVKNCNFCDSGKYTSSPGSIFCDSCPYNSFNPYQGKSSCYTCPPGGICPEGAIFPFPSEGHWRDPNNRSIILRCLNPSSCSAKCENSTSESCIPNCGDGYGGFICGECLRGYYLKGSECLKCPRGSGGLIFALCLLILFVCFLFWANGSPRLTRMHSYAIIIGWIQIISLFGSLPSRWPQLLVNFYEFLGFSNLNLEIFSPECSVDTDFWTKWQLKLVFPVFVLLGFLLLGLIFSLVLRYRPEWKSFFVLRFSEVIFSFPNISPLVSTQNDPYMKSRPVYGFLNLLLLMQVLLASASTQPFNCVKVDENKYVLKTDSSVFCYDEDWYSRLPGVIIAAVFYILIFPSIFIAILLWNRNNLHSDRFLKYFGMMSVPFRIEVYYWEVVNILRKNAVVVLIDFLSAWSSIKFQIFIIMCLLVVILFLQAHFQPYRTKTNNFLSFAWIITCILCLFTGVLFDGTLPLKEETAFAAVVLTAIIITILYSGYAVYAEIVQNRSMRFLETACAKSAFEIRASQKKAMEKLFPMSSKRVWKHLCNDFMAQQKEFFDDVTRLVGKANIIEGTQVIEDRATSSSVPQSAPRTGTLDAIQISLPARSARKSIIDDIAIPDMITS